jgi:hypothetical protein
MCMEIERFCGVVCVCVCVCVYVCMLPVLGVELLVLARQALSHLSPSRP